MLTNNGKALLYVFCYDGNYTSGGNPTTGSGYYGYTRLQLRNGESGGSAEFGRARINNAGQSFARLIDTLHIVVGSGTTPPTVFDYNLAAPINDNNFIEVSSSCRNAQNGTSSYLEPIILACSKIYYNKGQEDIIVNEIGIMGDKYNASSNQHYLFAREVLDSPVVVHPGESATFSITIG